MGLDQTSLPYIFVHLTTDLLLSLPYFQKDGRRRKRSIKNDQLLVCLEDHELRIMNVNIASAICAHQFLQSQICSLMDWATTPNVNCLLYPDDSVLIASSECELQVSHHSKRRVCKISVS